MRGDIVTAAKWLGASIVLASGIIVGGLRWVRPSPVPTPVASVVSGPPAPLDTEVIRQSAEPKIGVTPTGRPGVEVCKATDGSQRIPILDPRIPPGPHRQLASIRPARPRSGRSSRVRGPGHRFSTKPSVATSVSSSRRSAKRLTPARFTRWPALASWSTATISARSHSTSCTGRKIRSRSITARPGSKKWSSSTRIT